MTAQTGNPDYWERVRQTLIEFYRPGIIYTVSRYLIAQIQLVNYAVIDLLLGTMFCETQEPQGF